MLERRVSKRSSATAMKHSLPLPPAGGATPKRSARADSHGSISVVDESYRALEMAHEELRELCAAQGDHLASLTTLAEERKLNESVFATMEAEHERTDAFLVELRGLLATLVGNTSTEASSSTSAGGRLQSSTVNTHAARSSAKSANSSTKAAHGAEMVAEGSPAVMAALREVVAQVRMKMAALEQVEQRHALRNRRLEKELKVVHQANTSSTDASTNSSEQCAVIAITNSAAEGLALQERIILLEDELKDATKDVQKLSQELRKHRQDLHTSTATVELQQKKIDELRAAMKRKDQHWADAEKRCRAAEGALVAGGTIAAPTRLSARGSSSNNSTSTSTAASPRDANNNIATPHTRLFTGAKMVELWEQCPTSLTQALIHDVAKALRLLDDAVYDVVWCRAPVGEPALHVRMMIRHGAQHSAEEIDTMVLAATCDALYALVLTSAAEKSTATASASVELMELRAQHATQVEELSQLRHRVREAEKELARRDDVEEDINVALENTANTLQDMHASMSAHRGEAERARAAEQEVRRELERCRTQSRQLESTIATLRASAEAEQSHAVDAAHLERVEAAHAATMKKISAQLDELTNQRDAATQALTRLQAKTTSKTSASAGGGGATTPRTPTSSAVMRESVEVAISLTQAPHVVPFLRAALRQDDDDGRTTSTVLANLLLAECALATGHAPRQMKRVEVKEAPPTLLATVELRCNVDGKTSSSALRDELHQLMHKRARFDTVVAYLEAQATAQQQQQQQLEKQPRSNTADAADVASLQAVDAILSEALTAVQRQTTQTPLQRAELLARRLRTLDTLVRSSRKEEGGAAHVRGSTSSVSSSLGNTTASAEVQELRDSLQRATQHKMDLEAQLKSMKEESASSTEALLCRVHRLEAALKEKRPTTTTTTAVADGEEVRRLKEEVERLRCHERRAANTAEEQTQMIDDLRVQLAQARSMVANPSATSAPAMSATSSSSSFTQNTNNNNNNAESGVGAGVNLHAENQRLRVQLREMEVDMSDFARIQASLQQALDATQKELRATRNDKRALMQELATKDDQQRELRRRLRMSEERPEGGTPPLASRRASMDAISPMMPKSPRSPGVRLQRCHTAQVLPSSSAELRSEALDASGSSSMLFQRQASAGSVAPTTMRNTFTTISTSGPRTLTPTGSYSSTSDKTPTTTTQSFQRSHTAFSGEFSSARPPQPQQPTARGGEDPHSASLRRQQRINIRKLA